MAPDTKTNRTVHEDRIVKRFPEMPGIRQETLATKLHKDWIQVNISRIEQKETPDAPLLQQRSAALKIPVEAIENFDEGQAVNVIANTFDNGAFLNTYHTPTFNINPIEEIKKLHEEKIAIYERMLKEKDEMMTEMKKLLGKSKQTIAWLMYILRK